MSVRYRKFEKMSLTVTRVYDAGRDEQVSEDWTRKELPRRYAVMEFLSSLDPSDVYGIVEESALGCPISTVVYYRSKEHTNGHADRPRDPEPVRDRWSAPAQEPADRAVQ